MCTFVVVFARNSDASCQTDESGDGRLRDDIDDVTEEPLSDAWRLRAQFVAESIQLRLTCATHCDAVATKLLEKHW